MNFISLPSTNTNHMENKHAPFSCQYTSQVPELLLKLNCSISISTYQAGKLIFLSPKNENALVQLPRTFEKPMGIAKHNNNIAIATKDEVICFTNSSSLAKHYPNKKDTYDALFMPRLTYHTGALDFHDLSYGENGVLFAVNTLFSCIVKLDAEYNFSPIWKPKFIDALVSEDRCHLNGMALENGRPKFATAFNEGNSFQSWREKVTETGIVIDIETNEILAKNLAMPHSPRIYNGELYVLLSAKGELIKINRDNGECTSVIKTKGFVRGMDLYEDYLFIGLSKLRKNSSTFAKLDFAEEANVAGIEIYHLPTAALVGRIKYTSSVDEIFDLKIFPDMIRPNILNTINSNHKMGLSIPESSYWAKEK